jgi:signal transduction histidine kinase
MRLRIESMLRNPRVQGAGDALLAFVLAATSVVPVLGGDPSWGRPKALGLVLALASTVPVAWRARRPLTVCAVVLAANGGCVYVAAPMQAAFQPFLALVLCGYSVGSRAEGRHALWVPPALAIAAIPMFALAVAAGQDPGNAIPSYVWLIAAWAVGRIVRSSRRIIRSWQQKNLALERANRELDMQRELQAQAAVMVERGRIARELHDVIAHNVSMMVVQAGAAERVLDGDHPHVRKALDVIASTGRQTVDEMRTLLGVLRSDAGLGGLTPQPSLADLGELVRGVREAGLPVTLRIDGEPCPLSQALDLSAFRIVQEALTNALKHAGPARAEVIIRYQPAAVELEIRDTSVGREGQPRPEQGNEQGNGTGQGHGLVGMRERVAMFGGEFTAEPAPSGGYLVRARMPFDTRMSE